MKFNTRPIFSTPGKAALGPEALSDYVVRLLAKDPGLTQDRDWLVAAATAVRDELAHRSIETARQRRAAGLKHVNYLSMEYLIGRLLTNNVLGLGRIDAYRAALGTLGIALEEVSEQEAEPGLGNGGLGRLAACFLDSLATSRLPSFGYGLRFQFGSFTQAIKDGWQTELPDPWLAVGNPWEFSRPDLAYPVSFGGGEELLAVAYDIIVPGFDTRAISRLRLWSAEPTRGLDVSLFNVGEHARAIEHKVRARTLTRMLYPDDSTSSGRELRLKQEFFLVSATIQDILRRHLDENPRLETLADTAAIHLNDTHPALAIPELMRLLLDVHGWGWTAAWDACARIFSYTNHTLMPEALETWPVELVGRLLPRHLDIIYEINARFLEQVREQPGVDDGLLQRVSLIGDDGERTVRMAHLCVAASHKVNGVSALHTELMKQSVFADFARLYPDRIVNKTNGVSPRRWLAQANPPLATLIDAQIGAGWRSDLERLSALQGLASDPTFLARLRQVKAVNKRHLTAFIEQTVGITIAEDSLFDVQVKRIHEYKRQLLNVLHVVTRYNRMRDDPGADWLPRTVIFAGKAAPAYRAAKLVIKLIHDLAQIVNHDPLIAGRLRVVFIPNYRVSVAELVIPAADLSEQISTAGTEASGTGNMKLALNGALTIGTEDGANIEIRDRVGAENMFMVGHAADALVALRRDGYDPAAFCRADARLNQALDQIASGLFSPDDRGRFQPLIDSLLHGDRFFVLADYASYVAGQDRVDAAYRDPGRWSRMVVRNIASMGTFSSDRAIREYADEIWGIRPLEI
jgi:starch phosphorylase